MLLININNLKRNVETLVSFNRDLIAVVKKDAYGCGVEVVCRTLVEECGIKYLFVNEVAEALEVLELGLAASLLIGNSVRNVGHWVDERVIFTINSLDDAKYLASLGLTNRVHIQFDTGMNRLGLKTLEEVKEAILIVKHSSLTLDGIYTHFSSPEASYASLEMFKQAITFDHFSMVHCCASSTYQLHDFGTHIRVGLAMYDMHQVMEVVSKPEAIRQVYAGETVGYGEAYRATKDICIAVLPIGYGNGYRLGLKGFYVLANGKKCPILGRICMNHMFVEIDESMSMDTTFTLTSEDLRASKLAEHIGNHVYEIYTGFHFREVQVKNDLL